MLISSISYEKVKRALLVGIDEYDRFSGLTGCVNDVKALEPLLARHDNGDPNFDCQVLNCPPDPVTRETLLSGVKRLLAAGADVSLFYFAGHGSADGVDAWLMCSDASDASKGIRMSELLGESAGSSVKEVVIVLDCCFAGTMGSVPQLGSSVNALRDGVTILAATRPEQVASETASGRGQFSVHLCAALEGGAADVLGKVTVAGLYAYLNESFGPWEQRPTFKANLDRLHKLRRCKPGVPLEELRRLPELFSAASAEHSLSPAYEPTADPKGDAKEAIFAILQRMNRAKLVVPVDSEHMYFAAIENKSCRLTPLGQHYWRLARENRI